MALEQVFECLHIPVPFGRRFHEHSATYSSGIRPLIP